MIHDLKPYPVMKDSGVPWLGEVPEHWRELPGKLCYREKKVPNMGLKETTVLSLSYGQIVVKPVDKLHGLVPASFETYQIVDAGNIIVRPTDLQNDWNSLRFGLSRHRGIITSAYMCLLTTGMMIKDYGHLLLHAYDLKKVFYGLGSGLRQNLDWGDFKYLPCVVPPLSEQAAIVRFLDHADRRIRRHIHAKQKLINLLEEQKQAIIHRAVTRGLDPNVQLKPPGVEWLEDVPEHWEVKRGKALFHCIDIRSSTGEEELLTVSSDRGVVPRSSVTVTMFKAESYVGYKLCWPGDLVINSLWAWANGLGFSKHHGIVSTAYGVYRLRKPYRQLWRYLHLALRSGAYDWQFQVRSKGIWKSRLQLTDWSFLDMPIILPPEKEAEWICERVAGETAELEKTVGTAEREIALLREYRIRLIADVVTGKLDVREVAANLPEEAEESESLDETETGENSEETMDEGDGTGDIQEAEA